MDNMRYILKTMYIHQLRWNVLFFFMLIFIMFLAAGCAVKHDVEDSTVTHVIKVDVESVYNFYTDTCSDKHNNEQDIDECIENNASDFLKLLDEISQGVADEIQIQD